MTERIWSTQQEQIFGWFAQRTRRNAKVTARAGTGKTTTIIEGINRAPERHIVLCAFNKRIKDELSARIANPNAKAQTLHSIGYEIIRRYWDRVKVGGETKDGQDRAEHLTAQVTNYRTPDYVKRLITRLHTKAREIAPHAKSVGDLTDLAWRFDCVPDDSWNATFDLDYIEDKALQAMDVAARYKPVETGIDYADMIYLPVRNGWCAKTADLVVVDEAQDMTVAQLEIAQGICRGRICVVGDDRQAIYGFRGADSDSLERLGRELDAEEFKLTITYRCGHRIVAEAGRLVSDFEAGPGNPAGKIASTSYEQLPVTAQHGDFILSRKNAPLVQIAMSLLRSGKRARIAGRDIGSGLIGLVRKLRAYSVEEFIECVKEWEEKQVDRYSRAKKQGKVDEVRDQAEMLIELATNARSMADIESRIHALFTDDGLGQAGVITCSSVHRAKGLEADRVFVLRDTLYPRGVNREEENIEYVAITRAKHTLVWVTPVAVTEDTPEPETETEDVPCDGNHPWPAEECAGCGGTDLLDR